MRITDINLHWERVINTMSEALLIISQEGRILSVNRSFEEMTGYLSNEVCGQPCTLLECQACEMALNNTGDGWCKLFAPDQPEMRRCRCAIRKKDGTYLPALKNASVLKDEDGTMLGAVETLTDLSEIDRLDRKVATLSRQLDENSGYGGIIGGSDEMKSVFALIEKAAQSDAPIIIFGESGTGKELVARAIHEQGNRRREPYVQLNCAALNEALLESELFGHVKGSFTGASGTGPAVSKPPTREICSWMKSVTSPCPSRSNCCGCWRPGSSSGWVKTDPLRWMCESLPPPTGTSWS